MELHYTISKKTSSGKADTLLSGNLTPTPSLSQAQLPLHLGYKAAWFETKDSFCHCLLSANLRLVQWGECWLEQQSQDHARLNLNKAHQEEANLASGSQPKNHSQHAPHQDLPVTAKNSDTPE